MPKIAACLSLLIILGSCSISYKVDVLLQGNQVIFQFARGGWFGGDDPVPVEHLWVRQMTTALPIVWELTSNDYNGRNLRKLRYGGLPSEMTVKTKAHPLNIGQIYSVELLALGGGGSQQFAILPGPGPMQPITILEQ